MALIYLDICCFNRPFDDQSQLLIRLQTEAKLFVQDSIRKGDHGLLRKTKADDRLRVADPVDFIRYLQGSEDEN